MLNARKEIAELQQKIEKTNQEIRCVKNRIRKVNEKSFAENVDKDNTKKDEPIYENEVENDTQNETRNNKKFIARIVK